MTRAALAAAVAVLCGSFAGGDEKPPSQRQSPKLLQP
jgi:hypothetical protein